MESKRPNVFLLAAVIVLLLFVDQWAKVIARDRLQFSGRHSFLGDTFRLEYAENRGAFLSLGSNLPEGVRTTVFSGIVSIGVAALLVMTFRSRDHRNALPLALVSAGGVGNLIDRFYRDGAVIDFLNVGVGNLRTGIFNVADMAIMGGILWLLLADFVFARKRSEAADPAS